MKQGAAAVARVRGGGLRGVLVGVQVALSMVLMCGAGLLLRGLTTTHTVEPGFEYRNVAVAAFDLLSARYQPEEAAAFARQLSERVAALPGVEGVAYGIEPLSPDREAGPVRLPTQSETDRRFAALNFVSPGYFPLLGIALTRGRSFTDAELASDAPVAIVSETTARNYWPGQDPLGQRLIVGPERELEVVGVAADAQVSSVGEIDPYYVYLPASSRVQFLLKLLVKSHTDFAATTAGIRAAVQGLDPGLWVRVNPLESNLDWSRKVSGMVTALAAALGLLALALAAVGIYGVVSYLVSRRAREIGVRLALGARAGQVSALILRQTMRPVVIGALLGLLATAGVGRALSSMLFGIHPADPLGLGTGIALVVGIALTAGLLAARRAAGVEPLRVLREE
jgi:predicted permease